MQSIKLFCLPFAGGNKYSYRAFEKIVPRRIQVIPLEYPGRGARMTEELVTDIHALTNDLYDQVVPLITGGYAIYGHSMGGLLGWLLTRKLINANHLPPIHLFVTGTMGPAAESRGERKRYEMSHSDFIAEIRELKGSPDEILSNPELLNYFEPILRADFRASETYRYDGTGPLHIPITVVTGAEENLSESDIRLWQKESVFEVNFVKLSGNHFFIFDHTEQIVELITKQLQIDIKSYQS